ncbi:M48 family metallopeptidase [Haloflavibacter putidus]|uniref:M48 family metallopeptidase n=1 Tax=Haloflavibacter putidus TaxID=2576776 RepID=A0A507ZHP3_9FLAO|nr:M48 family metallopeptidase [Haloflavibacter putidus]TQD36301.1 M48 family metallopeptidase [Haloflavibacter putidus]
MAPETLFYILIGIILLDFIVDYILGALNAEHFKDKLPEELSDVYEDEKEYFKAQEYKKANYEFGNITGLFNLLVVLSFFLVGGFEIVDQWARTLSENPIIIGLIFFGIIMFGSDILNLPFSYYQTFIIEEEFGFNKTTHKTFLLDKLKSWLLLIVLGGGILAVVIWFYTLTGSSFWLYAWALITVFSVIMNMFYSKWIVPLFNKQTPLEEGSLRRKIERYATKAGFQLDNIFIIDGSKRSTKANAYFSGFGKEKRITLYDTLVNDLDEDEIVAVLAHEVGHYKKKHILYNLGASILTTGLTLWLLSVFIDNPLLSQALGVEQPSFHVGLIAFGILYSPISAITGLLMNYLSRKFEYQADSFAQKTYGAAPLISGLKTLSAKSLSNLTPHKAYVFVHYSHPTLLQRIRNLGVYNMTDF